MTPDDLIRRTLLAIARATDDPDPPRLRWRASSRSLAALIDDPDSADASEPDPDPRVRKEAARAVERLTR